jgi:acyl dehydratase
VAATLNVTDLVVQPDEPIAVSDWIAISQATIDRFAEVTGDTQWIHTDPVRAASGSPFGGTIAHGFLTLALISRMLSNAVAVAGAALTVNYGLNRVRFVDPVRCGSRIRGRFAVAELTPFDGGIQVTWNVTVEREGGHKPCCVAQWVIRYYRDEASTPVS